MERKEMLMGEMVERINKDNEISTKRYLTKQFFPTQNEHAGWFCGWLLFLEAKTIKICVGIDCNVY